MVRFIYLGAQRLHVDAFVLPKLTKIIDLHVEALCKHCLRVLRMHFSLIFTRHEGKNANFVECNASDAGFNSHSMPSLVSLSSSSYSSDSALSPSSSASQSLALRSLSPSSAYRFHQSHCDSNALGYHVLWVADGICVTASAVSATAGCYVKLVYLITLILYYLTRGTFLLLMSC